MYGQMRIGLVDRAVGAAGRLARAARLAARLATRTGFAPTDLYAAWMTARFQAAGQLIDQIDPDQDPDTAFAVHTAPWTGGMTRIYQEDQR